MTARTKAALKGLFETGDVPTGSDFADLIDSFPGEAGALGGGDVPGTILPAATLLMQGAVELATREEVAAGSDGTRAVTPWALFDLLDDIFLLNNASLLDRFSSDMNVLIASPMVCEPGPDSFALIQIDGNPTKSGGKLNIPAQSTPAMGDQTCLSTRTYLRALGLSFRATWNVSTFSSNGFAIGWLDTGGGVFADCAETWWIRTNTIECIPNLNAGGNPNSLGVPLAGVDYIGQVTLRNPGAFYLMHGGIYTNRLMWVSNANATATLKAGYTNHSIAATLDDAMVIKRGGGFASQYGLVTDYKASPVTGDTLTMRADAVIEFTWTAATGETLELMIRRTDDSNCWIIRCSQAGSTLKLIEKVAGVETERRSGAVTFNNGTAYRIVVTAIGQTIEAWVANVKAITAWTSAASFMNGVGVKVSGFATGAVLAAWPAFVGARTGTAILPDLLVFDGNSLTAGTGVTINYPDRVLAHYPKDARAAVRLNFGVGGQTWLQMSSDAATQIDPLLSETAHARSVLIAWEYTNDPVNAYTNMQAYINARKAAGWQDIIILSALPHADGSSEVYRTPYNDGLRANADAWGIHVADVAAIAAIGAAGAQNDTTYYNVDKVHQTDAGCEVVAVCVHDALAELLRG